ncbi:hypothetical protein NHQ30_002628 [Ciborinia camelliae]|nr:hypothetical protein NHQ30_002628 [Ciborinia camelliae]
MIQPAPEKVAGISFRKQHGTQLPASAANDAYVGIVSSLDKEHWNFRTSQRLEVLTLGFCATKSQPLDQQRCTRQYGSVIH